MRWFFMLMAAMLVLADGARAAVLDRVKATGKLTLGFRSDTMPFSYRNGAGEPDGYSVTLCKRVGAALVDDLGLSSLAVELVEVTAEDRFTRLMAGEIDLLCSADTVTLARREQVDFSLLTFSTGATLLYRADGPKSFEELEGGQVGVREGTTTEALLRRITEKAGSKFTLVPVDSHEEGVQRLLAGELGAYFGDGAILLYHFLTSPDRDQLKLSDKALSFEPYALVLPRGDADFRLAVDRVLARIYRSGEIKQIFKDTFGGPKPSELIEALYTLQGLPE